MKKISVWIFYILLASALGVWIWSQRPGLAVVDVLPSHPLVFARLGHVQEHIDRIIRSDFGKSVASIDLPDVLNRNNFSQRDIRDFKRWQDDVVQLWGNPLIKKFLSKEVSIAVYPGDDSYKFFVTLRLTLSTRIAEALGHLSHHWSDDISVRRQKYDGRVINCILFKKQGLGLAYVRIRDLLIITPGPWENLKELVDVYQHQHQSLAQDPSFNFIRRNAYPDADGLVFVNSNLISGLWRGEMDTRLTSLGYQTSAFPVYGLSYLPGVVTKYKMMVGLDEKHIPKGMRKVFSCPALDNDTLKLVPVDAIAYNWGGCYDLNQVWATAKEKLRESPELAQGIFAFKKKFEKHFHISLKKDVLPVLGHEVGGYLTDVDMQGSYPFPLPRVLIFVKIQNQPAAQRLLDRLVQKSVIEFKTEDYDMVDIHYISSSLGANMDPGYGFLGDYLLVATSRQLLKRSIDAYNNSLRSIVSDDLITQFSLASGQKFHSVTLMKTAELSRRAQDFLAWMDKYLSDQVTMAAAYKQDGDNKKEELDQAIADKSAELVLAQKKLVQLKSGSLANVAVQDPDFVNGAIENLNREEENIKDDIAHYTQQKQDLSRILDSYASGAQSAKLTMYNMDNLLSPVLKGLESIDAQAVTVRFGDKMLETEMLVK